MTGENARNSGPMGSWRAPETLRQAVAEPPRRRKRRPLPCPRQLARSAAGWPAWRRPPRPTPARRKPTTPGAPTPPTGKCSPPGCAARALSETPPDPEAVGLYLASQVERGGAELSVATLERRLSGIAWRYRQLGQPLDIRDRHIATVLAGIRRRHARPPLQKAAIFADELLAMLATLDMDLRGLRDRAILAIGFAGGLRRSEIVGLDCGPDQTEDGSGWVEIFPEGALLTIRGKTGWREVEIGRGSRSDTCPVASARDLAAARADRPRAPLSGDRAQERRGRIGAADGQACRPLGEDLRARRRAARRSVRGRTRARLRLAIRCAPVWPLPPKSKRRMCKNT